MQNAGWLEWGVSLAAPMLVAEPLAAATRDEAMLAQLCAALRDLSGEAARGEVPSRPWCDAALLMLGTGKG